MPLGEAEVLRKLKSMVRHEGETRRLVREIHQQVEELARLQRMRKI